MTGTIGKLRFPGGEPRAYGGRSRRSAGRDVGPEAGIGAVVMNESALTGTEGAVLSVFGLGYVGCVSAVCFAGRGHDVIGVDVDPRKLELLRQGVAPIIEERIGDLTAEVVSAGRLVVTADAHRAVLDSDITLVCVGTPSTRGGRLSTSYLESVTDDIGAALRDKNGWHTVVYRSTMLPGTCADLLVPRLEHSSGKRAGVDFGVCVNPEFLREGTGISDFLNPAKTVIGECDPRSAELVGQLYEGLPGTMFRVPLGVAEMIKFVDNSYHALKVDFANEIGALCAAFSIDSHDVMDIFLADTKLNLGAAYLRPGFAFGGSCLPKDVRALTHAARSRDVEAPLLSHILPSNEAQVRRAVDKVLALGKRRITLLGLAFKAGTDDLRESPMVELAERLIGKGCVLQIFDPNVAVSCLMGSNEAYIKERLPHLADLLTEDLDRIVEHAEVMILGTRSPETLAALDRAIEGTVVVDLVRLPNVRERRTAEGYVGMSW